MAAPKIVTENSAYNALPPSPSLQERLVTESLMAQTAPNAALRTIARRPLFPPRFGYPDKNEREPGIRQVLTLSRYRVTEKINYSSWDGGPGEISASARNIGVGQSGTV